VNREEVLATQNVDAERAAVRSIDWLGVSLLLTGPSATTQALASLRQYIE